MMMMMTKKKKKTILQNRQPKKRGINPLKFLFCAIFIISCTGQPRNIILLSDLEETAPQRLIELENIIQSRDGTGSASLPDWLLAYINGGNKEVESLDAYTDKFCFIGRNEGNNFDVLSKWIENYSVTRDFTRLAAVRIEQRLLSTAAMNPDDEYGYFYERLVKMAFDTEFSNAHMEDTYWIRTIQRDQSGIDVFFDNYEFFVFVSIDRISMQAIINNMIAEVYSSVTPTRIQNNAINRLRQTFFEGF